MIELMLQTARLREIPPLHPEKSIDYVGAFFNEICLRQVKLLRYEIHCVYEICLTAYEKANFISHFSARKIFHNPSGLFHINGVDISLIFYLTRVKCH